MTLRSPTSAMLWELWRVTRAEIAWRLALPIGVRPAHCFSASSFSEQMLPRWRWSISKAFERVTLSDLMLASPGRVLRSNCSCGFFALLVPLRPTCLTVIFGLKPKEAQLTAWK